MPFCPLALACSPLDMMTPYLHSLAQAFFSALTWQRGIELHPRRAGSVNLQDGFRFDWRNPQFNDSSQPDPSAHWQSPRDKLNGCHVL